MGIEVTSELSELNLKNYLTLSFRKIAECNVLGFFWMGVFSFFLS